MTTDASDPVHETPPRDPGEWMLQASERLGQLGQAVKDLKDDQNKNVGELKDSQTQSNKQLHARIWRVEKSVDRLSERLQNRCEDCDAKQRLDKHEANHKENGEKKDADKKWYRDFRVQWWIAVFTALGFGAATIFAILSLG